MLLKLIPLILQEVEEYQALFAALDVEVEALDDTIATSVAQSSIMEADEDRVTAWESFLSITAEGDLYQRKLYVIATLTSVGKLNKTKIEEIVNIYTTGAGAEVSFDNSVITVKVKPPSGNEDFLFPDIERTLTVLKPAHLGLVIIRFYSTYADIAADFASYGAVETAFATYTDLKNYIQEE